MQGNCFQFFVEGYTNKNYDYIMECMSEDYYDHSPAARSNKDAVGILKIVAGQFSELKVDVVDIFSENGWSRQEWFMKASIRENVWESPRRERKSNLKPLKISEWKTER